MIRNRITASGICDTNLHLHGAMRKEKRGSNSAALSSISSHYPVLGWMGVTCSWMCQVDLVVYKLQTQSLVA